jgi:hypothetical protein
MKTIPVTKHAAQCDKCGDTGPEAYSEDQAKRAARDRGWAEEKGRTLCAECRK